MSKWLYIGTGLILFQAVALYLMGQPDICECGYVKLWEGAVVSSGNSQHLSDWYTPSHIIHGLLFYLGLWLLFPKRSVWFRLMLALGIEIGWELFENTDFIINRYREQALAQGYTGDSVINSLSDTLAMVGGFLFASRFAVWASIALLIVFEMFVGYSIRDNLTLNIVQLVHPIQALSNWQSGGGH